MIILTKEQIIALQQDIIKNFGGGSGIREVEMLESAINSPFATYGGVSLFPSIYEKAARLGFGIIKNHPFVDGNKRIGVHSMLVFLSLNGIELNYTQEELYTVIIDVAAGDVTYEGLLEWIKKRV